MEGWLLHESLDLAEKLRRLRFYGMEKTYYSLEQGIIRGWMSFMRPYY